MPKNNEPKNKDLIYRNGKKVYLKKEPDQFVVRALVKKDNKKGSGTPLKGK